MQLPKAMLKAIPSEYHDKSKGTLKLLWEDEWRGMGITQVGTVASQTSWPDADYLTEPWLGALRGPRAGAPYSSLQVSTARESPLYRILTITRRPLNYQPPQ